MGRKVAGGIGGKGSREEWVEKVCRIIANAAATLYNCYYYPYFSAVLLLSSTLPTSSLLPS